MWCNQTLIRGMAKRRSLRNPMANSLLKRRESKNSRNGDGRGSPAHSPSPSPTHAPGSASPKRRHSFKLFKPKSKTQDTVDCSSSPPVNHRVMHNSSPLTGSFSWNSPPNTPTSSPPRSPVMPRSLGQGKIVKSNSQLLNEIHTATGVSNNVDCDELNNWLLH